MAAAPELKASHQQSGAYSTSSRRCRSSTLPNDMLAKAGATKIPTPSMSATSPVSREAALDVEATPAPMNAVGGQSHRQEVEEQQLRVQRREDAATAIQSQTRGRRVRAAVEEKRGAALIKQQEEAEKQVEHKVTEYLYDAYGRIAIAEEAEEEQRQAQAVTDYLKDFYDRTATAEPHADESRSVDGDRSQEKGNEGEKEAEVATLQEQEQEQEQVGARCRPRRA